MRQYLQFQNKGNKPSIVCQSDCNITDFGHTLSDSTSLSILREMREGEKWTVIFTPVFYACFLQHGRFFIIMYEGIEQNIFLLFTSVTQLVLLL